MTTANLSDDLRTLWRDGAAGLGSDADLLARFAGRRDEAAFAALVDRHGAMVLRACLAVLGDPHEAQDCGQATFLLLARRAHAIRRGDSVGPWLFGVARRVALRARREAHRRRHQVAKLAELASQSAAPPGESWADLHAEIDRLPETERAAILACDLEGLSHEAAAHRLGWTTRSVGKRLYRGRERLRLRLIRRGLTLAPAIAVAVVFNPRSARAMAEAARGVSASAKVLSLANGASRAMKIPAWKTIAAAVASSLILAGGLWARGGQDAPKDGTAPKAAAKAPATKRLGPTDAEARDLLRRAAEAAVILGREPVGSWSLTELAAAQAEAGDREGARATFRKAIDDALAQDKPTAWSLWRIGHFQVEAGDKAEARTTLAKAAEFGGKLGAGPQDRAIETLSVILQDQVRAGDDDGAKATLALAKAAHAKQNEEPDPHQPRLSWEYPAVLAIGGEVDEAFAEVERMLIRTPGNSGDAAMALGKMAEVMAARDRNAARPIIDRIARRMAIFKLDANAQYAGLISLGQALARVGRVEEARQLALSIGRDSKARVDMTDGQSYALLLIAIEQQEVNDVEGAKQTLRLALQTITDNPKMRGADGRYVQIAPYLAALGDVGPAREAMGKMQPGWRHHLLYSIASMERLKGDEDAARADFRLAVDDARAGVDTPPKQDFTLPQPANQPKPEPEAAEAQRRAFALADVAAIQAGMGDLKSSEKTLDEIRGLKKLENVDFFVGHAQQQVNRYRASGGDLGGALAMALKITDPDAKRKALQGVASGYRGWKKLIAKKGQ